VVLHSWGVGMIQVRLNRLLNDVQRKRTPNKKAPTTSMYRGCGRRKSGGQVGWVLSKKGNLTGLLGGRKGGKDVPPIENNHENRTE